jgi:hypothetical protein
VLHTAEGATTIESLGSYFQNEANQVSSHVGIDDKKGVIGEYVKRGSKAWTAANANPVAVQAELCGFAKWSSSEWHGKHSTMLDNAARWIAEEAAKFGVPITKLSSSQAQGSGRGVCQHSDLGSWGGSHTDCGAGFPIDDVIKAAKNYASGGGDEMGYPQWFWDWARWYYTTDRNPAKRPAAAPDKIPQWAWEAGEEILSNVADRYGMTKGERDWLDWRAAGADEATRPDVYQTIPDRWWEDNSFFDSRLKAAGGQ